MTEDFKKFLVVYETISFVHVFSEDYADEEEVSELNDMIIIALNEEDAKEVFNNSFSSLGNVQSAFLILPED